MKSFACRRMKISNVNTFLRQTQIRRKSEYSKESLGGRLEGNFSSQLAWVEGKKEGERHARNKCQVRVHGHLNRSSSSSRISGSVRKSRNVSGELHNICSSDIDSSHGADSMPNHRKRHRVSGAEAILLQVHRFFHQMFQISQLDGLPFSCLMILIGHYRRSATAKEREGFSTFRRQ